MRAPRAARRALARPRRRSLSALLAAGPALAAVAACFVHAGAPQPPSASRRAAPSQASQQRWRLAPARAETIEAETIVKATLPPPPLASSPVDNGNMGKGPPDGEGEPSEDGKALDTSSVVGNLGALVVSLAVIPYVPVSLYSSFVLATTGKGVEPGPNGVFGLAEGFATLTVFGVVSWSVLSRIIRGTGLPAGLFGFLGLTEGLSYLAVAFFALSVGLNQLDPEDNPARGFTFDAPEKSAEKFSAKTIKGIDKASRYIEKETAPSRAALDAAMKDAAKQASDKASEVQGELQKKVSDVKVPELKVNTEKIKQMEAMIKGGAKEAPKEAAKEPERAPEAPKEPAAAVAAAA